MNRSFILFPVAGLAALGGAWLWHSLREEGGHPMTGPAIPPRVPAKENNRDGGDQDLSLLLSPRVRTIIRPDPGGLAGRKQAIDLLSRNLEAPDLAALMDFMGGEPPPGIDRPAWHGLVDQLANRLQQQDHPPSGLTEALVRMFRESDDPTLKDYAIQYLRSWYAERGDFYGHEPDMAARGLILRTLIEAASHTDRTYSGTAIMALHDALDSPELAAEPETTAQLKALLPDYDAVLIKVVEDPATDKHCRISTLQICAMRGMTAILPTARALAADPSVDPNIRISSIAAIGRLGSLAEDEALLKTLSQSGLRLSYAAEPALKRLAVK
jgi:hypothetical protein